MKAKIPYQQLEQSYSSVSLSKLVMTDAKHLLRLQTAFSCESHLHLWLEYVLSEDHSNLVYGSQYCSQRSSEGVHTGIKKSYSALSPQFNGNSTFRP